MRKIILLVLSWLLVTVLNGQSNSNDSTIKAFIPNFAYAAQFPGGDLSDLYGFNSTIGGGFFLKTKKNVLYSLDVNFIFGNKVKQADTILWMIVNSDGAIIDANGIYPEYAIYERGYSLNFRVGKILNVLAVNPNSGLMLMGGAGYLAHRMLVDVQGNTVPQLRDDYGKGYDRLRTGLNLNEFIGYFYMGRSRLLNFYAGFEFYQTFTKMRRERNFDMLIYDENTGTYKVAGKDNSNYLDLFFGIRIGWMIPVYDRAPDSYYYN